MSVEVEQKGIINLVVIIHDKNHLHRDCQVHAGKNESSELLPSPPKLVQEDQLSIYFPIFKALVRLTWNSLPYVSLSLKISIMICSDNLI